MNKKFWNVIIISAQNKFISAFFGHFGGYRRFSLSLIMFEKAQNQFLPHNLRIDENSKLLFVPSINGSVGH